MYALYGWNNKTRLNVAGRLVWRASVHRPNELHLKYERRGATHAHTQTHVLDVCTAICGRAMIECLKRIICMQVTHAFR